MRDHELKPCPFCGGANTSLWAPGSCVVCTDCGAEGPVSSDHVLSALGHDDAWNTRADLPPTPAEAMRCPEVRALVEAMRPFAEAAMHLHPATPNDATTLDGIDAGQWRAAYAALAALEQAVRHE